MTPPSKLQHGEPMTPSNVLERFGLRVTNPVTILRLGLGTHRLTRRLITTRGRVGMSTFRRDRRTRLDASLRDTSIYLRIGGDLNSQKLLFDILAGILLESLPVTRSWSPQRW